MSVAARTRTNEAKITALLQTEIEIEIEIKIEEKKGKKWKMNESMRIDRRF